MLPRIPLAEYSLTSSLSSASTQLCKRWMVPLSTLNVLLSVCIILSASVWSSWYGTCTMSLSIGYQEMKHRHDRLWILSSCRHQTGPRNAQLTQDLGSRLEDLLALSYLHRWKFKHQWLFRCQSFESRFIFINTNTTQTRASWYEVTSFCASIALYTLYS